MSLRMSSICALDGCFGWTRRAGAMDAHDAPLGYAKTRWVLRSKVEAMQRYVEDLRQSPKPVKRSQCVTRVRPNEATLEVCDESFKAAHEHLAKANANRHVDTGVMSMVCRHDIPIFFANIYTPGERQFYALALVKELFEHLPPDWVVGVMYDIGCQLEASMMKVR